MAESFPDRAPENPAEHIRQLLAVNAQQAARLKALGPENLRLKAENERLRANLKAAA